MNRWTWFGLAALAIVLLAPSALAQVEDQSCYGAYDFFACEQVHHEPPVAVVGGAVTIVAVATGVAIAGPSLFPWAKGIDDTVPLDGEEEVEPDLEEEPLTDPWDGRHLPMKKGQAWWQRGWLEEEEAEEHVEDARRAILDREALRAELATERA